MLKQCNALCLHNARKQNMQVAQGMMKYTHNRYQYEFENTCDSGAFANQRFVTHCHGS